MKVRITVNNYGKIKGNFNIYGLRPLKQMEITIINSY